MNLVPVAVSFFQSEGNQQIQSYKRVLVRHTLHERPALPLTMPKMTGDKLVKKILNIRPDIPVILCTGFSEKIDEKEATSIGAADYIEKPVDQYDFAFKVRRVLDEKKV